MSLINDAWRVCRWCVYLNFIIIIVVAFVNDELMTTTMIMFLMIDYSNLLIARRSLFDSDSSKIHEKVQYIDTNFMSSQSMSQRF